MDEEAFLNERRRVLKESVEYFSNPFKPERERWVCRELLRSLHVDFVETDIVSSDDDPPDVLAFSARFEVKEILDPGRERHRDYKAALDAAERATNVADLLEEYSPRYITPREIGDLVVKLLVELERKYPITTRHVNDLALYVNLEDHYLKSGEVPDWSEFSGYGWRSISVLENQAAMVLYARDDAPHFLRQHVGRLEARCYK